MKRDLFGAFTIIALAFASISSSAAPEPQKKDKKSRLESRPRAEREARDLAYLTREIRKELVTLPYFSVFDWLEGNVEPDGVVYLRGQVTRPTLRKDAQSRVERVEGVDRVINRIEVLPLSPNDDLLRRAVFRELFNSNSPLFRYGRQPVPPIHIIINRGRLTLKGVVANKGDSDLANIKARGVSGLFEVRNELRVERD
ncbi:MAG TPA: BON domain-containing protein [Blastocatellia bacterium]|nr:BON domain-containing protein [Blastocatellia bacterium]